jgi:hypothetical protein
MPEKLGPSNMAGNMRMPANFGTGGDAVDEARLREMRHSRRLRRLIRNRLQQDSVQQDLCHCGPPALARTCLREYFMPGKFSGIAFLKGPAFRRPAKSRGDLNGVAESHAPSNIEEESRDYCCESGRDFTVALSAGRIGFARKNS